MKQKELVLEDIKSSLENAEFSPEKIFLFNLFKFDFSYDEEKKQCMIECPVSETMFSPLVTLHGGIHTYLADTAIGHLNFHFKDDPYVALELKTTFIKTADSGKLTATARYIKDGYNVLFSECEIKNEKGELLSTTSGTFYRVKKR